jgi:hypothetical protein
MQTAYSSSSFSIRPTAFFQIMLLDGQALERLDRYQTVRPLGRTFWLSTITD